MELARSPYLRRLNELGLIRTGVTAHGLISILESKYLSCLTTLGAAGTDLSVLDGWDYHRRNTISSAITSLDLGFVMNLNVILPILVKSPLIMNLNSLDLSSCDLQHSDVEEIARSPYLRNITNLNLNDWVKVLAQSINFSKLTSLKMHKNKIGDAGV